MWRLIYFFIRSTIAFSSEQYGKILLCVVPTIFTNSSMMWLAKWGPLSYRNIHGEPYRPTCSTSAVHADLVVASGVWANEVDVETFHWFIRRRCVSVGVDWMFHRRHLLATRTIFNECFHCVPHTQPYVICFL